MTTRARTFSIIAYTAGFVTTAIPAALADDAADCAAGIEKIKAEIAKNPAADTLETLNKFLKDAEREAGEQEFDECLEAVEDAMESAE